VPFASDSVLAMEVRGVASIISARVCRLLFQTSKPAEALDQFMNFVVAHAQAEGPSVLAFRHRAWMAQQ
jgi:hypothetical protein